MSDMRRNKKQQRESGGKKTKAKGKFKPEYIAYGVLALLVVAVVVFMVIIFTTTSGSGGTNTFLPCCN